MVDQDFSVDTKLLIEPFFVLYGTERHFSHRIHVILLQAVGLAGTDLPEIGKWFVVPEPEAVGAFVQLCDTDAILVRRSFFCDDVHGDLGKIQVGADPDSGGDPSRFQYVPDHDHRHDVSRMLPCLFCFRFIEMQVRRCIDEYLIHAVYVDVLCCGVPQIDGIDQGRDPFVFCHARCRDIVEDPGVVSSFILPDGLFCFEEPRP